MLLKPREEFQDGSTVNNVIQQELKNTDRKATGFNIKVDLTFLFSDRSLQILVFAKKSSHRGEYGDGETLNFLL